ncbi:MAG: hypothetical protein EP346_06580 [Bacteroidetes bacterium]|nr:MAG: hypothetical protein EP346_06580 [Bacteroidota bacterium]
MFKKMTNQHLRYAVLLVFFTLAFSDELLAQPGNPNAPAPLGAIPMLVGAAIVYGGVKYRKKNL